MTHAAHSVRHLKINSIAKEANFADNGATKLKFDPLGGGQDGGFNGIDFVEISDISVTQDDFSIGGI